MINRSDEPVFDVAVTGARLGVVDWSSPVIAPSAEASFMVYAVEDWEGDSARSASIEFTDARGKRWRRLGPDLTPVKRS